MEVVDYKRNGIRYRQVWFNRNTGIEKADADIIEFRESHVPLVSSLVPFRNGTISLARPLDEILSAFDKGFLYEVRRAEKENIVCAALSEAAFDLHEVYRIYRDFCVSKGLDTISLDFFRLYYESGALKISVATKEDKTLQYHLYFGSKDEMVLLASFPGENLADIKKSLIGYANRCLHWFDIKQAHGTGVKLYNLGGIGNSNDPTTEGIVKFKMEMSPDVILYYNGAVPVSTKGKLYMLIKKLLRKNV